MALCHSKATLPIANKQNLVWGLDIIEKTELVQTKIHNCYIECDWIVRGVVLLKNNEDEGIKEEERIATNSSFVAAWYCFISQIVVFKLHAYDQTKRSLVAN